MGIVCALRRVSDTQIAELLQNPQRVLDFLSDVEELNYGDTEIDLDKAWHGIHFLLTGSAENGEEPLNFLLDGEPIGTEDVGYGPARAFRSTQVAAIDAALSAISNDDFRERFNPTRMTQENIYPSIIWNRDPKEDDTLGYLVEYFGQLKSFVRNARDKEDGFLVFMC